MTVSAALVGPASDLEAIIRVREKVLICFFTSS